MIRLEVENQIDGTKSDLDINDGVDFKINKSANDVREITRRKGSRSQEFTLPFTEINNSFFNHFYDVDAVGFNFSPSIKTIARVYDGGSLEIEGYLKLQDVNRTKGIYKVVVVDGFIDFATALGDATLNELFIEDDSLDHVLSQAQIIDSWGAGLFNLDSQRTLDVFYPLMDWGYNWYFGGDGQGIDNQNHPIFVEQFRPAIRIRAVLSRIFARAGFVWDSAFLDGYDKFMTLATGNEIKPSEAPNGFEVKLSANQNIPTTTGTVIDFGTATYNIGNGFSLPNDEFTCLRTGEHEFSIEISGSGTSLTYLDVEVYVNSGSGYNLANTNGNVLQTFFDINTKVLYNEDGTAIPFTGVVSGNATFIGNLIEGDKIQIKIYQASQNDDDFVLDSTKVLYTLFKAPDGSTIRISQNMYDDIKQIDFVRAIFERYNLWAEPSKGIPNQLIIEPFEQFFEDGSIKDITDFIDQSSDIITKPMSDFRAKKLIFQDLESENFLSELYTSLSRRRYGSKKIETKDQFAQGEIEVFSVFEPATHYKLRGSEVLTVANYERNDEGLPIPRAARPMIINKVNESTRFQTRFYIYDRVAGTSTQFTSFYSKALSFDGNVPFITAREDDNFQLDTFFYQQMIKTRPLKPDTYSIYWQPMIDEVYSDESKLLTCRAVFPKGFVSQLRMADTLRIKTTNFRLNKLIGYTSKTGEATLELIKRVADIQTDAVCDVIPDQFNIDGTISFINPVTGAAADPTRKCCELAGGTFTTIGESPACLWRKGQGQGSGGLNNAPIRLIELTSNNTATSTEMVQFDWPTGLDVVVLNSGTWIIDIEFIGNNSGTLNIFRYSGVVLVVSGIHSGSFALVYQAPASSIFTVDVDVEDVGVACSASSEEDASGVFKFKATRL